MKWYDLVAPVYDGAVRSLYLPYRRKAVQSLRSQPGHTVLDLGCGSGLNFELIMEGIGPRGTLVGSVANFCKGWKGLDFGHDYAASTANC